MDIPANFKCITKAQAGFDEQHPQLNNEPQLTVVDRTSAPDSFTTRSGFSSATCFGFSSATFGPGSIHLPAE